MNFSKKVVVLGLSFTLAMGSTAFGQTVTNQDALDDSFTKIGAAVEAVKDSKHPVDIYVELCGEVGKDLPQMSQVEADKVTNQMLDFAFELLQDDMTSSESKSMVKAVINHVIGNMNSKSDAVVVAKANDFLSDYMIKTVVLELNKENYELDKKVTVATLKEIELNPLLLKMKSKIAWMSSELKKNEVEMIVSDYRKVVSIVIDKDSTVEFQLNKDQLSQLNEAGVDVALTIDDVTFNLNHEMLKNAKSDFSVRKTQLVDEVQKTTNGGHATGDFIYQLDVTMDGNSVEDALEVAMPLGDLNKNQVIVGEYNDQVWDKLKFDIEYNQIKFDTNGNNIYGRLTYETSYNDLTKSQKEFVLPLVAKGYITGTNATAFNPNGSMTRAELTEILVNYLDLEGEVSHNFTDVDKESKYYDIIGIAGLNSLTVACEDGNFRPFENVTKEEAVGLFERAYLVKHGTEVVGEGGEGFADEHEVAIFAKRGVAFFDGTGFFDHTSENFYPKKDISRAEIARMLYVFDKEF